MLRVIVIGFAGGLNPGFRCNGCDCIKYSRDEMLEAVVCNILYKCEPFSCIEVVTENDQRSQQMFVMCNVC